MARLGRVEPKVALADQFERESERMILYDYFRSSAAYRVRLALALKGIEVEHRPVHLLRGEQLRPEYLAKNPQGLAPALELDDGTVLTQSLAIIDYLETLRPAPALIPKEPVPAARVRAAALAIACEIHPLGNTRVIAYLQSELQLSHLDIEVWRRHWILKGLEAVEQMISPAPFCFGEAPTLADVCLVPQLFNARQFDVPLQHLPRLLSVDAACGELAAFRAAHPAAQLDAE